MPILWRHLIGSYFRVFILCTVAFIAILLTSRLEEIAHFSSLGADMKLITLFTLFQIPYILPIAIPISCLIAAILLMQRLSQDNELTALRSSGFSIKKIMAPILIFATFISIFNFYTVSELATLSHLKANFLKAELRSINPLLLLHNKPLMQLKGIFYDAKGGSKLGQSAKDVVLVIPDEKKQVLNLFIAGELSSSDSEFTAKRLSMITPIGLEDQDIHFETIPQAVSSLEDFSQLIQKKVHQITNDALNMGFLLLRRINFKNELAHSETPEAIHKSIHHIDSEIARRISAGLSPFTFTLLGAAFGMSISRIKKRFSLAFPIVLASFYLICFFSGKAAEGKVFLAYSLYLIPHFIIITASLYKIEKISHGTA